MSSGTRGRPSGNRSNGFSRVKSIIRSGGFAIIGSLLKIATGPVARFHIRGTEISQRARRREASPVRSSQLSRRFACFVVQTSLAATPSAQDGVERGDRDATAPLDLAALRERRRQATERVDLAAQPRPRRRLAPVPKRLEGDRELARHDLWPVLSEQRRWNVLGQHPENVASDEVSRRHATT